LGVWILSVESVFTKSITAVISCDFSVLPVPFAMKNNDTSAMTISYDKKTQESYAGILEEKPFRTAQPKAFPSSPTRPPRPVWQGLCF